jgi:hypothetical protein
MGTCLCGSKFPYCGDRPNGSIDCNNGTVSRRAYKKDITYLEDADRAELAQRALDTHLARYRYTTESPDARRHLGFIIDDQPDPSPAIDADRTHVDLYGYSSMLLAALQEQSKELRALRERIDLLEKGPVAACACSPAAPRGSGATGF